MSWSSDVLKILTLRCEEASLLASREIDEPLGLAERVALCGHSLVCRSCRRLRRQLLFLHVALQRHRTSLCWKRRTKMHPSRLRRRADRACAGGGLRMAMAMEHRRRVGRLNLNEVCYFFSPSRN